MIIYEVENTSNDKHAQHFYKHTNDIQYMRVKANTHTKEVRWHLTSNLSSILLHTENGDKFSFQREKI